MCIGTGSGDCKGKYQTVVTNNHREEKSNETMDLISVSDAKYRPSPNKKAGFFFFQMKIESVDFKKNTSMMLSKF